MARNNNRPAAEHEKSPVQGFWKWIVAAGMIGLMMVGVRWFNPPEEKEEFPPGWRPAPEASLSVEQKARIEQLEALGYLAGYEEVPQLSGVTVHDASRAYPGYNLCVSGHGSEAHLIDMDGKVVHQWGYDYKDLPLDENARKNGPQFWRRAFLLPQGGLLAIFEADALIRLDRDSNLKWCRFDGFHHDLHVAQDGTLYALVRRVEQDPRVRQPRKILQDYIVKLSSEGEIIKEICLMDCLKDSPCRGLMKELKPEGDIFHTNTIVVLDGRHADKSEVFKAGNIMLSILFLHAVVIIDPEQEKAVWSLKGPWKKQHQPELLENGNLLLFDNLGEEDHSRIFEIDPLTQKVVWKYRAKEPGVFFSEQCGSCERLPNGNTLITESFAGRAFEVTPGKDIVWEYYNPHRAGEEQELIATLFDVVRIPNDAVQEWLPEDSSGVEN